MAQAIQLVPVALEAWNTSQTRSEGRDSEEQEAIHSVSKDWVERNRWSFRLLYILSYFIMLSDAFWCFLMLSDAFWCFLMLSDAFWCFLMLSDAFWCFLMLSDAFCCLLIQSPVVPVDLSLAISCGQRLVLAPMVFSCMRVSQCFAIFRNVSLLFSRRLLKPWKALYTHRLPLHKAGSKQRTRHSRWLQSLLYCQ